MIESQFRTDRLAVLMEPALCNKSPSASRMAVEFVQVALRGESQEKHDH
jgi:hypothetical protein